MKFFNNLKTRRPRISEGDQASEARKMNEEAISLANADDLDAALALSKEVARRFGDANDPEVRAEVVRALKNSMVALGNLGCDSKTSHDVMLHILAKFGKDTATPIQKGVLMSMLVQANTFWGNLDYEEALDIQRTIVVRFEGSTDTEVRCHLAESMACHARYLERLSQTDHLENVIQHMKRLFEADARPEIQGFLAQALISQGSAVSRGVTEVLYTTEAKPGSLYPRDGWGDLPRAKQLLKEAERKLVGNNSKSAQQALSQLATLRDELPTDQSKIVRVK